MKTGIYNRNKAELEEANTILKAALKIFAEEIQHCSKQTTTGMFSTEYLEKIEEHARTMKGIQNMIQFIQSKPLKQF